MNITESEIFTIQAHAVATDDHSALCDTYEAFGFGRRVPVEPTADQILAARGRLARRRDEMQAAGTWPSERTA